MPDSDRAAFERHTPTGPAEPQGPNKRRQRFAGKIASHLARPFLAHTHRRIGELHQTVADLHHANAELHRHLDRVLTMVRHVYDEEPANRRRLYELRSSEEYELAFTEEEPLVSFIIPTYDNITALRDVSLPSILSQSYTNIEVIVVGDASPPETAEAIAALDDPRVRYYNRTVRGPYPDSETRWYVVGTPPYNDGLSMARGRWITGMGDDDSVRPEHTVTLLRAAKDRSLEHCYGRQLVHFSEGEDLEIGEFPPRLGQWGQQAAIYHGGLSFFGLELADALYKEPNDWSLCRRMLRAGVRFGMVDDIVVDKLETRRTATQWSAGAIPDVS